MVTVIRTSKDFATAISRMLGDLGLSSKRILEEYLRALYRGILARREATPSYGLFVALLGEAFRDEPAPFDEAWLEHSRPPGNPWLVPPDLPRLGLRTSREEKAALRLGTNDFDCLARTLQFQIADLRSMTPEQLGYKWRYMGLKSPRGNDWYNWDPFVYVERGTIGFLFHLNNHYLVGSDEARCNWAALADLLEMGRLWE